jgi:hypothetical protein
MEDTRETNNKASHPGRSLVTLVCGSAQEHGDGLSITGCLGGEMDMCGAVAPVIRDFTSPNSRMGRAVQDIVN